MGKVLERLRHGETYGEAAAGQVAAVLPLPARGEPEPIRALAETAELDEEAYPFIEVGGPGKKVEGSPEVVAAPARPQRLESENNSRHINAEAKVEPAPAPRSSHARAITIAFEPWPANGRGSHYVAPEIITYHQPDHPASKHYAELFGKIIEGSSPTRVILLAGAGAKAGTTTVLLNLAFSGAGPNRRIIVLEANPCRPALAERLGLGAAPGWRELLAGQAGLEKLVHLTAHSQISALTAGASRQGHLRIVPEAFQWALAWLRDRFDLILIDGPEVSAAAENDTLVAAADDTYLVLPHSSPDGTRVSELSQTILRGGGQLRGLIHTQFETL